MPLSGKPAETWIIVADDDEGVRGMVSQFLQKCGYSTVEVCNGLDALQLAKDKKFQLIMADVNMPGMGGLELLRELLKLRHRPSVIVLSGLADSEIARHALKLGAFDYISKPFAPQIVESTVSACMSHRQYNDESWWMR